MIGHMIDADTAVKVAYATQIDAWASVVIEMINSDIEAYTVVAPIRCWNDLFGYVDVNEYTNAAGVPWGTDAEALGLDPYDLVNAVQCAVDRALHTTATEVR